MGDFKLCEFDRVLRVQKAELKLFTSRTQFTSARSSQLVSKSTHITLGAWLETASFILNSGPADLSKTERKLGSSGPDGISFVTFESRYRDILLLHN